MSQSFYDFLSTAQKEILDRYKSNDPYLFSNSFANDLNKMLCEGKVDPDWQPSVYALDSIVSRYPLPEPTMLYRVTSEELFLKYIEPIEIPYPAFMSTSSGEEAVKTHYSSIESENAMLLKICAPAGYTIAPMEHGITSGMEEEFLLGRNARFVVTARKDYIGQNEIAQIAGREFVQYLSKLTIIELTLIP